MSVYYVVQRRDCVELVNSVYHADADLLGFVEVPYEFIRMLDMTKGLVVEHLIEGPALRVVGTDVFLNVQDKRKLYN